MDFYTSIIILSWMGLAALCVLVMENSRIAKSDKRLLYLTYGLIALSALAEWCGVRLDGRADMPSWLLRAVKCIDYILTPMAGGAIVMQIHIHNRWQKAIYTVLATNTAFQIASAVTGRMLIIDEGNHYHHGPLFPIYMGVCGIIIVIMIVQFVIYGKSFMRENQKSLYSIMTIVVTAILLQEIGGYRTAYIGMTLGAALMFIHYSEFSQMAADEYIRRQQAALDTDPLSGLLSRYAYNKMLKEYASEPVPEDLAVFAMDINGLKKMNDKAGHEAGDEMIRGAAECIRRTFGESGRCYRIGGDEFLIIMRGTDDACAKEMMKKLQSEIDAWHGEKAEKIRMSAGYALASDAPGVTIELLVNHADNVMYAAKAEFYRTSGEDRRRSR